MNAKWLRVPALTVAVAVGWAGSLLGATANKMPSLSTSTGWSSITGEAQFTSDGEQVKVIFPSSSSTPPMMIFDGAAAAYAEGSPVTLVGNYVAHGIHGMGVRLRGCGVRPSACKAYFRSTSGRSWFLDGLPIPVSSDEWAVVTIPFDYSYNDGRGNYWVPDDEIEKATAAMFYSDLTSVDRVGVFYVRSGQTIKEEYVISDFMLFGGVNYADGAGLYRFMVAHGLKDADADDDGDTMSGYAEFKAGTDPKSLESALKFVRISVNDEGQTVLTWASTPGVRYVIRRSEQLGGAFEDIATVYGEAGAGVTSFTDVDSAGDKPKFYRIVLP